MKKEELEEALQVGTKVKIGPNYAKKNGWGYDLKPGQVIELIEGYFDEDNGLYCYTSSAPSIGPDEAGEYDSIYHLFGNDFEHFMDCEIVNPQ